MNISVSKSAYEAMVNVYTGDEVTHQVTREEARAMKLSGTHYFINHGKDIRRAKQPDPQTEIQERFGWMPPFGRYRSSALNEGRVGQFTIGYPIPYAFKGHLKAPKALEINYEPR
jgi:hypothetical protein